MPAQGRGPRAGGGAQSPESPNEVRSPRPRLVERAGGRARKPERQLWKGGQVKNNPLRLGSSRALSRLVRCQRTPGEVALGRAERDSPSSAGRGARLRAAAARVWGRAPEPPAPGRGRPLPRTRRSWQQQPPPQPRAVGGKRSVIYYLRALIGLRHKGWGPGRWGDRGVRGRGGEGGAATGVARRKSPPDSSLRPGAVQGAGRAVRAFDFASPSLSFGVLALPGARGGGCGLYAPPCAPLAAVPTQPGPHLSSSLVKWSVQGTAASLG